LSDETDKIKDFLNRIFANGTDLDEEVLIEAAKKENIDLDNLAQYMIKKNMLTPIDNEDDDDEDEESFLKNLYVV